MSRTRRDAVAGSPARAAGRLALNGRGLFVSSAGRRPSRLPRPWIAALLVLAPAVLAQPATPETATSSPALSTDGFHFPDEQLEELTRVLLAENPRIAASRARARSSFARVAQDASLPDPRVSYRFFAETPETRVGPQEHMLELSQTLPWSGKRRLQARRAQILAASQTFETEDLARTLVAELKRTYYSVAYVQEALRVNREEQELLRRFESIALKRYATGQGIQQSVVKVQTEISRLDDRESELHERLDVARRRISALVGRADQALTIRPIVLALPGLSLERARLEELALAGHPRVHAVKRQIDGDRTWVRRRELDSKPDFHVGLGYTSVGRREDMAGRISPPEGNGQDIFSLTAGINIPVFRGRVRAGVAEARESERARRERLAAVRDALRFDIQDATLRVDSLTDRAQLHRDVIIPQAEESLASAEAAYTTNRLPFLELLDAERVLFRSRLAYHRLVTDLWIALAELELSTARPMPPQPAEKEPASLPETGSPE